MFEKFTTHINHMEQIRSKQNVTVEDVDSFLLEQRYLCNIAAVMKDVSELRSTFLQLWQESQELESKRVLGIYTLYEEIVKSNQSVYGAQVLK